MNFKVYLNDFLYWLYRHDDKTVINILEIINGDVLTRHYDMRIPYYTIFEELNKKSNIISDERLRELLDNMKNAEYIDEDNDKFKLTDNGKKLLRKYTKFKLFSFTRKVKNVIKVKSAIISLCSLILSSIALYKSW